MKLLRKVLIILLLSCASFHFLIAEEDAGETADETGDETVTEVQELPRGFRNLSLGMQLDEVKQELIRDTYFLFRGDPDVSMLARPNSTLIECRGFIYIDRAFFQFDEEKLYTIILKLNPNELDFYSVFTQLTEKYGESDYLDPEQVVWKNDSVQLSLERPLSVKYIDLEIFESIRESARVEESVKAASRKDFLEMF
jgi:hypothetical protein